MAVVWNLLVFFGPPCTCNIEMDFSRLGGKKISYILVNDGRCEISHLHFYCFASLVFVVGSVTCQQPNLVCGHTLFISTFILAGMSLRFSKIRAHRNPFMSFKWGKCYVHKLSSLQIPSGFMRGVNYASSKGVGSLGFLGVFWDFFGFLWILDFFPYKCTRLFLSNLPRMRMNRWKCRVPTNAWYLHPFFEQPFFNR